MLFRRIPGLTHEEARARSGELICSEQVDALPLSAADPSDELAEMARLSEAFAVDEA